MNNFLSSLIINIYIALYATELNSVLAYPTASEMDSTPSDQVVSTEAQQILKSQTSYEHRKAYLGNEAREDTIKRFEGYMYTGADVPSTHQYFFRFPPQTSSWDMKTYIGYGDGGANYVTDQCHKFPWVSTERYSIFPGFNYKYELVEPLPYGEELDKNLFLVENIQAQSDLLANLPDLKASRSISEGGPVLSLRTMTGREMASDENRYDWVFKLFKNDLQDVFRKHWVWNDEKEKRELNDAHYLFVYEGETAVAYSQFRICLENDRPNLHVHAQGVDPSFTEKNISTYITYVLARIAESLGIRKTQGLGLRANSKDMKYMVEMGFELDPVMSPPEGTFILPSDDFQQPLPATYVFALMVTKEKLKHLEDMMGLTGLRADYTTGLSRV